MVWTRESIKRQSAEANAKRTKRQRAFAGGKSHATKVGKKPVTLAPMPWDKKP